MASAVWAVGKDILLCADDGTRDVLQVTREYDGVTTHGNVKKISFYSEYISNVESITVIGQFTYFSASSSYAEHGGLLRCSLETGEVLSVLSNSENPPSEVWKISTFDTNISVLTDRKAKQVKMYDPEKDSVKVLFGSGQEGRVDGLRGHLFINVSARRIVVG